MTKKRSLKKTIQEKVDLDQTESKEEQTWLCKQRIAEVLQKKGFQVTKGSNGNLDKLLGFLVKSNVLKTKTVDGEKVYASNI